MASRALSLMAMAMAMVMSLIGMVGMAVATANGVARRPPMGYNTWNAFHCGINETLVRDAADALVRLGLRDLGYEYVVIDDCWASSRAADGSIRPDGVTFPSGIAALAAYVHAQDLKFGACLRVESRQCSVGVWVMRRWASNSCVGGDRRHLLGCWVSDVRWPPGQLWLRED
jgi:hypothetical protein